MSTKCKDCGFSWNGVGACPNCGADYRNIARSNKSSGYGKYILIAIVCIVAILIIISKISEGKAENKYSTEALNDAKNAIFLCDQFLDGNIEKEDFKKEMSLLDKSIFEGYESDWPNDEIYSDIHWLSSNTTQTKVLQYRNELAKLIGEKTR